MAEQIGHRLAWILSVFVCVTMLMGLMVAAPDSASAYPDSAWIMGSVTDGTNPVPNVYIKTMVMMGDGEEINYTMTDLNGDYAMMVPGGLSYMIFAANGSYYMALDQVTVRPGETEYVNFTLIPIMETADVTISGYVTDEHGMPRSDGVVLGIVNNPMGGDAPYYANLTVPNATGYFEVNVIPGPNGGGAVGMDFPGYPMAMNGTEDPLLSGMSYTFNIELEPRVYNDDATVYGYVTEIGTGLPIASALVSYESDDGMERYTNWTMTNETGFYLMGVRTGDYFRMTYQRAGYTVKFIELDIFPGQTVQQDVQLRKTDAMIRGNVTDGLTGDPIVFSRVFLVDDPYTQENMTMAITDSDGYFELDAFEGTDLYFGAEQDGYARNFTIINVTSGDELWYDLTLMPYSAWLVGQVTDARTGAPLSGAQVHLMGPLEQGEWTDGMGMYNFSLIPGDYTVEVYHWGGWAGYKTYSDNVTLLDGVETVLNVALMPWDNALIYGRVYDVISGDPIPLANIWLNGPMWGNGTMSNETGDYGFFAVDGDCTIFVNAADYQGYSQPLFLPELSVTPLDIGLMPNNPEPTVRLHGYVNNSDDGTPIAGGAEVRVRLDGGQFEINTWSNFTGYYEMFVPAWGLNVRSTSNDHAPYFGFINASGQTEYELDIQLDRDLYEPNLTFDLSPSENISWSNPSWVQAMIEEQNLRDMTLIRFMEWNSTGLDSNWTMVDWRRTSFDPWNPETGLPYSMVDGNYSVNDWWDATAQAGWLSDGVDSVYLPASTWPWYMEPVYVLGGYYSNATSPREQGAVLFNSSTGAFVGFAPNYMGYPTVLAPDPTGVFEPNCLVIEYDDGWMVDYNWRALDAWSVDGLTFTFDNVVPTGAYKSVFSASDWGNRGNGSLVDLTVDQEPPVAEAGPNQNVATDYLFTLDGTASFDNVGVVFYVWEFYNATGVWTVLYGDTVTYSFESVGAYLINLTVWDAANHLSTDSLIVDVFLDLQPVADAGPDQDVGQGDTVYFDGSLSYDDQGIVDYTWYIAELMDWMYGMFPEYTFWDPGVYHVSLAVTDTVGHIAEDEMIVTVHDTEAPVADAGWDQWVMPGDTVFFDGSMSWDNVGIVSYVWSFSDGAPVELYGMYPDYTFFNPGMYQVTLAVYDAEGNPGWDDMWVTVDSPPIADAGPDQWVDEDTTVYFDGSWSWDDDGIIDYYWWIEGLSDWMSGPTPQYTFSEPGVYRVWLSVTDTSWQTDDDDMYVTVFDVTPPWADAGWDQWVMPGSTVTLDGSWSWDNVGIVTYEWLFLDGVPIILYGMMADYTFNIPGAYQVTLTVYDAAGNWAWDDVWVYVDIPPIADAGPDQWVDEDTTVYFDGTLSWDDDGIIDYTWYIYEEDVWMYGPLPDHTFWTPGVYNVRLTVTDTSWQTADDYMVVTVFDVTPPYADAGPDQFSLEGWPVTFDGWMSYDNVGIVDYVWSFFDIMPVELHGMWVDYIFSAPGSYTVTLTVYDSAGYSAWDDLLVTVNGRPVADAGPDQTADEDTSVSFDGSGSWDDDVIVDYLWYIVELDSWMYGWNVQYMFPEPGTYHVTLEVVDSYGQVSDWDEAVVTIEDVTPPVANAGSDQYLPEGSLVTFDGSMSSDNVGIVDYVWSFFDVMPVELHGATVDYSFSAFGTYLVTLTVYDAAGNSAWDDLQVTMDARPIADAGPDQTVDEDAIVTFDGSASWDDDGIVDYVWSISELSDWMYGVGPQYIFSEPGVYHVTLVVEDTYGQFSDSDEVVITVEDITPPTAEAGSNQLVNDGTLVTFDGSASTDNVGIVDYTWGVNDVFYTELYGPVVSYTFSGPGGYWVDLWVTDAAGNTGWDDLYVTVNGPPIAGSPGDQWINPGGEAYFNGWASWDDLDWYYDLEYNWTFIYDGSEISLIGNDPDVYFQFLLAGDYTVTLTVTDTGGLSDSTTFRVVVASYMSAWWVDPITGDTIVDGGTVALNYATLMGYVDSWEQVNAVSSTGTYQTWADGDGLFQMDIDLAEGLNIVTVSSYSDWYGDMWYWFKMIQSDTFCKLWVDSPESPTAVPVATISGWTDPGAVVTVNGLPTMVFPDGTFSVDIGLLEGLNPVTVVATDLVGNMNWVDLTVEVDTTPPALVVGGPADGANVSEPNVVVFGTAEAGASVWVNGVRAVDSTDWSVTVSLVEGANTIVVTATDSLGNTATETLVVNYVPPVYVTPEELAAVRAELLGEINNLSASLQENVSLLQDQIDSAMDEISALQASLLENITDLQSQIDTAMDGILDLQASLAENISLLQDQINSAIADIAALQASVAENVTDLQDQIYTAMADIVGLQASLLENVTDLQTQITDAVADIVDLEAALTESVTALQDEINDAVLDIAALQGALAENVTLLESEIAALEADLQANVTALQQAIAENATDLQQAITQNITALQSQIAAVRAELQANVTSLTAAIADNVTALDGLIDALDQEMTDMQADLVAINNTLTAAQDDLSQSIDTMQAVIGDLQDQIIELNQSTQDDIDDVEDQAGETDSFASMLMYLTLILFAIAIVMIGLVWYLTNKKFGKGGAGARPESLEEVEPPTEAEQEFESLEKEMKQDEL